MRKEERVEENREEQKITHYERILLNSSGMAKYEIVSCDLRLSTHIIYHTHLVLNSLT